MSTAAIAALAMAIGCAGFALHLAPAILASPTSCPGLFERAAIAGARLGHSAPLGLWLVRSNRIILAVVLAIFAGLAYAATGTWAIAAAVGLAFAAQPAFSVAMSAFDPLAVGVAGLTLFALWRGTVRTGAFVALLMMSINAAIMPRAAVPMAAIAGGYAVLTMRGSSPRRWVVGGLLATAVVAAVAVLLWTMPGLPPWISPSPHQQASCLVPALGAGWAERFMRLVGSTSALSGLVASAGPLACSLAAMGVFSLRARLRDTRAWPVLAYIATPAVMGAWPDASPDRTIAPTLVALWLLAAVGLAEILRLCRETAAGPVAAVVLIALLPLLNIVDGVARPAPPGVDAAAFGRDRMSLDGMRRALQAMPVRTVIISEDAAVDILLRGLDGTWQRAGKTVQLASSRQDDVAAALRIPSSRVFALPLAQVDLPYLGFRLVDAPLPGLSGVAEVHTGGTCLAVGEEWQPMPEISRLTTLAVVSEDPRSDGAIAIYAGSDRPIDLRPIDWPAWAVQGFMATSYSREEPDRVRLEQDILKDGLARDNPVLREAHVVRLELWKMIGAPARLVVDLGAAAPSIAVARGSAGIGLQLCPAFPHAIRAIALPR
jgi:hypothetical protein